MINSLDWLKILAVSSSLLKTLLVAYPHVIIKTADGKSGPGIVSGTLREPVFCGARAHGAAGRNH